MNDLEFVRIEFEKSKLLDFILNLNKVICWLDGYQVGAEETFHDLKLDQLKIHFDHIFNEFNK